jgi:hypothetical protein
LDGGTREREGVGLAMVPTRLERWVARALADVGEVMARHRGIPLTVPLRISALGVKVRHQASTRPAIRSGGCGKEEQFKKPT